MSDIIAPIVNMNGTSGRQLLKDACAALEAIRAAQEALSAVAPHGRDYIHADSATYDAARAQWGRWRDSLNSMAIDIEALAIKIKKQVR